MIKRECFHPEEVSDVEPGTKIRMSWGDRIGIAVVVSMTVAVGIMTLALPIVAAHDHGDRAGYARGREHGREIERAVCR